MPSETLRLPLKSRLLAVRPNRCRRPSLNARQIAVRFFLILVGLALLIGVLMRFGIILEPGLPRDSGLMTQSGVADHPA